MMSISLGTGGSSCNISTLPTASWLVSPLVLILTVFNIVAREWLFKIYLRLSDVKAHHGFPSHLQSQILAIAYIFLQRGCCCLVISHGWLFCGPIDFSLLGSSVHGTSQARILDQVAFSFSRVSSWPRDRTHASCLAGGFFTTEPSGKPSIKR